MKDEIKALERTREELVNRLAALQTVIHGGDTATATGTDVVSSAANSPTAPMQRSIDIPEGLTLEQAQRDFERAYAEYAKLAGTGQMLSEAIQPALDKVNRTRLLRDALKTSLEDERAHGSK